MAPLPPATWPVPSPRRGNWFHSGQIPSQLLGAASPVMWAQILSRHTVEGDMGTHCPWAWHARGISGDSNTEGALRAAPPRPPVHPPNQGIRCIHDASCRPTKQLYYGTRTVRVPWGLVGHLTLECE